MKQWFVVQTQPMKEIFAQKELEKQGFDVYLPRYKKTRRHARREETVLAPLFPRYLFISLDLKVDRWRSINGTRGVSYLLANDECPAPLPIKLVETLKSQENEDHSLPVSSLSLFSKGDSVLIKEGAFEGHTATFETLDDRDRVLLLLTFLGREMRISVPLYMIETA